MGIIYKNYLNGPKILTCSTCQTHLSLPQNILSRAFHGHLGKAYLMDRVINYFCGQPEDRKMATGTHTVCDIRCVGCETIIGWKYLRAYDESQKYKEGKFVLEVLRLQMDRTKHLEPVEINFLSGQGIIV